MPHRVILVNIVYNPQNLSTMSASPECRQRIHEEDVRDTYGLKLDVCCICLQTDVQNPRITSCGHGLCRDCMSTIFAEAERRQENDQDDWAYNMPPMPEFGPDDWNARMEDDQEFQSFLVSSRGPLVFSHPCASICWLGIGDIDMVAEPNEEYPVPNNPYCYSCRRNVPNGIYVRISRHEQNAGSWHWVCAN